MRLPPCPTSARLVPVLYVAAVMAVSWADGLPGLRGYLLGLPGSLLLVVCVLYPLAGLFADPAAGGDPSLPATVLGHGAGAAVNVLVLWGVLAGARCLFREYRDACRERRARGRGPRPNPLPGLR